MKRYFSALAFSLLVVSIFSFKTKSNIDFNQTIKLFENEQLKIESHFVQYKVPHRSVVKNYLLLTVINKTRKELEVHFERKAYYNDMCYSCNSPESRFVLYLKKKATISGNLTDNDKTLKVFHSFQTDESKTKLTDLIIDNVIVKNL
jgi:hypothetical protein